MAVTPVFGWRLPDGGIAADGPDAFADLAIDIENTLSAIAWNSYTPAWTSRGSVQPANPSTKVGRYRIANGWCDFSIVLQFGVSTNGGNGALEVGLPVAASSQLFEQVARCKLWLPTAGGQWAGTALIPAGSTSCRLMMSTSGTNPTQNDWRNADSTNAAGTGFPQIAGKYAVESGGNMIVSGRYMTG